MLYNAEIYYRWNLLHIPRVCQTNKRKKSHYVIIVFRKKKKEGYARVIVSISVSNPCGIVIRLVLGHSMTNRHRRLTTTSPILIKIGVCGYLIAKTHWCKYYVSTTNTF